MIKRGGFVVAAELETAPPLFRELWISSSSVYPTWEVWRLLVELHHWCLKYTHLMLTVQPNSLRQRAMVFAPTPYLAASWEFVFARA
jgi:hypothetical protein